MGCTRGRAQLIHHRPSARRPPVNKFGRSMENPLILQGLFIHNPVNKSAVPVNKLCISIRCRIHNKCYDVASSLKERGPGVVVER